MKLHLSVTLGLALIPGASAAAVHDRDHPSRNSPNPSSTMAKNDSGCLQSVTKLPPLPSGVEELKFSEFFVKPVGKRGLEATEKLQMLDGKRVRILGYMVRQEEPPPGRLLLAPIPAEIHEHDNGLADDLPASLVYVSVPTLRNEVVPYVPGLMLLTGTLSVGNCPEEDGRVSLARLALDPPEPSTGSPRTRSRLSSPPGKGAERLMSRISRNSNAAPKH